MLLTEAVDILTSARQDLDLLARGLVVDSAEVAAAISKALPDSAESVVLQYLAKYNPIKEVKQEEPQKIMPTDDTNSEQQ